MYKVSTTQNFIRTNKYQAIVYSNYSCFQEKELTVGAIRPPNKIIPDIKEKLVR
jgi:hypothetical protein